MYADDTQLYLSIEPENISVLINNLEKCISDVKDWMFNNKLKLNDKTGSVLFNLIVFLIVMILFRVRAVGDTSKFKFISAQG